MLSRPSLQEAKHLDFAKYTKGHELTVHIFNREKTAVYSFIENSSDLFKVSFLIFRRKAMKIEKIWSRKVHIFLLNSKD